MSAKVIVGKRKRSRISTTTQIRSNPSTQRAKWSIREMRSLAYALEKYGFGDISKITAEVGSRSEAEVKYFMERWSQKVYTQKYSTDGNEVSLHKLFTKKNCIEDMEDAEKFPPIAIWKRAISNMVQTRFKHNDCSNLLSELFYRFAEEEAPYVYKDLPNFQEVYKYLAATLAGNIPPVPSDSENLILHYLYLDVKNFINTHDMKNEEQFFKQFRGPHRFQPIKIKKEEAIKKEVMDEDETRMTDGVQSDEAGPSGYIPNTENQPNGNGTSFHSANAATLLNGNSTAFPSDSASIPGPSVSSTGAMNGSLIDGFNVRIKTEVSSDEANEQANGATAAMEKMDVVVKEENPTIGEYDYIPKGPTIDVPEHLFDIFKLHEKIKENLNPMIVPVWMQQVDQKAIKAYFDALE